LFISYDGFVELFNSGWSGQLNLSFFELILGIIGMAFGGGIGYSIWYLTIIKLKVYDKHDLDQEL